MYDNPRHRKDRKIKLRFDDDTYELIEALANFHRTQKAVLLRDLVEAALQRMADSEDNRASAAA